MEKYTAKQAATLLEAVKQLFPESSNNTLRSWIKQGRISVNGRVQENVSCVVNKGQTICLSHRMPKPEGNLKLVFEDSDIVVIQKPCGLLSVASENRFARSAHSMLKKRYYPRKVFVIHRLDQDTSGLMMFARSELAYRKLKEDLAERTVRRVYVALVEGSPKYKQGSWKSYLYEDENLFVRSTEDSEQGELAISHYKVVRSNDMFSMLQVSLETGKKNQIRVQCQDAGHPVVGDRKYGSQCNPLKRLCLHAERLEFTHPRTGKRMEFLAQAPQSFEDLFQAKAEKTDSKLKKDFLLPNESVRKQALKFHLKHQSPDKESL